jgi:hypothetical protein
MLYILGLGILLATLAFVFVHFTDVDRIFDRYYGIPTLILMYVLVISPIILIWYFELPRIETEFSQQIETANKRSSLAEERLKRAKEEEETAKQETETAKQQAETEKQRAETAKQRAETAKQQAETAKQEAERTKRTAETAMQEAEHAREEAETRVQKAIAAEAEAVEAEQKAKSDKQEAAILLGEANTKMAQAQDEWKKTHDANEAADNLLSQAKAKTDEADEKLKKALDEESAADKLIADANTMMGEAENELKSAQTKKEQADKVMADATAKMKEAAERVRKAAEDEAAAKAAEARAQEDTPIFHMPPPHASAIYYFGDRFRNSGTMGDVVKDILTALDSRRYFTRSFFETNAGGVALVTQLEKINDDGSSAPEPERWPEGAQGEQHRLTFSWSSLVNLVVSDRGRYRIFVFVIQDTPLHQDPGKVLTDLDARALFRGGLNFLPSEIQQRHLENGNCTALIYEFLNDGSGVRPVPQHLDGRTHLDKAGLQALLGENK